MERVELACQLIEDEPLKEYRVVRNDGPAFAGRFPFGFAPICKVSEGEVLEFSPRGVANTGRDFSDAEFGALCEAVRLYQQQTIVNFTVQLPPDLVVLAFVQDVPDAAAVLTAAARHHRVSLARFVGADRGVGIQL